MSLYLVTGPSGSGKTTICNELKTRGYLAYDGDIDQLARWYDKQTGELVDKKDEKRTPEFVRAHTYLMLRKTVESLAIKNPDVPVFIW